MSSVDNTTERLARRPQASATDDLMRAEAEHRTINLLQLVCLNLERSAREVPDERARRTIERAAEQLAGVGRLLRSLDLTDARGIDVQARLREICDALEFLLLQPAGHSLTFRGEVEVSGLLVAPTAGRCLTLIVTEFVVNAAKHAFSRQQAGLVTVSLGRTSDHLVCTVRDDGEGALPSTRRRTAQGLALAERLAAEAGGCCRWLFTTTGTLAEVTLPFTAQDDLRDRPATAQPALWRKLLMRDRGSTRIEPQRARSS